MLFLTSPFCFQINRPITMKKDGIQTRKRKPKNPAKEGSAKKTLSSSYSYLKQQQQQQNQQEHHQVYQRTGESE